MGFGIIWMPVLFYHFAYLYAPWKEKKRLVFCYVITAILAISAATPYYIPKVELVFDSFYYARPGITFYILAAWWFIVTGYSHTKLYKDSKKMPKERQNQIKYFILASTIGYLGGVHDFSVAFGLNIYPWTNYLVVVYPFIMAYAVIKHGLFDIFIFIKKAFVSAVLVGVIAWGIGGIGAVNGLLQEKFGLDAWIAPVFAGIIAVYLIYLFLENSRAADRAKQEFITIAAHKLRTPLTHIRYIADELKNAKTKEETDLLVANLKESNDLLINLVNKLLDVTNLQNQSEKYEFNSIDLKFITERVLKNVHILARDKNLEISFSASENLPLAEGYEKSTQFVIQSLTENAIIYTPNYGKINIDISSDKNDVIWSIKDTGIGISKEDTEKIFEKFFRGQDALKTETEGTGLALFMSRNLIKRQGGKIRVESEGLGQGSRFWFTLPIYEKK